MKTSYITIEFSIPEEYFDPAIGILSLYPICGIEEKYDYLSVTFDTNDYNENIESSIITDLKSINSNIYITNRSEIDEKNWNEEWEKSVEPVIISPKLGIAPSWRINELMTEIMIIINPKMSFGTGSHESTRLLCKLMLDVIKPHSIWIDAGTGTGLLAILAIKLGTSKVFAVDNNIWAIENASENMKSIMLVIRSS